MNKHILLVTDSLDDKWVELLRNVLKAGDNTLTVAESGRITLAMEDHFYDITIVDSSTIADTAKTVAELRADPATQHILVLTTVPGWRQAREMFHAGADDYRLKSYDEYDLRRMTKDAELMRAQDNDAGARPAESHDYC